MARGGGAARGVGLARGGGAARGVGMAREGGAAMGVGLARGGGAVRGVGETRRGGAVEGRELSGRTRSHGLPMTPPIDIVYTWVDGGDPGYQRLVGQHAKLPADSNPERYRDGFELLRYSLRSLCEHVPWAGDVHLVTCRPQVPAWLDGSCSRLHVIHHDEIFEDPALLPTFNCNAIESHLHRIPTSSDWFLYVNDDFLFGSPTPREDFLLPDGRTRVHGSLLGERFRARIYEDSPISMGFIEHTPYLIYKPYWEEMLRRFAALVADTRRQRFRHPRDVRMDRLYRYHLLTMPRSLRKVVPFYELVRYHCFVKVTNDFARVQRGLERIRRIKPHFYCLNDDQGEHADARVVGLVRSFLEESLPHRSPFERACGNEATADGRSACGNGATADGRSECGAEVVADGPSEAAGDGRAATAGSQEAAARCR